MNSNLPPGCTDRDLSWESGDWIKCCVCDAWIRNSSEDQTPRYRVCGKCQAKEDDSQEQRDMNRQADGYDL